MALQRNWDPKSPHGDAPTGPTGPVGPPAISSLSPNTAEIGTADFIISVNGSGFGADAVIVWNGGDEPTTVVDSTRVTTVVKPSTASGPFTIPIQVRSGGVLSNSVPFSFTEVTFGPPIVDSLSPNTAVVGGPDFEIAVIGSNFDSSSVIVWNGGDEPTTLVSERKVTTLVKPSTASGPFTVPVAVRTDLGLSNSMPFSFTA